MDDPVIGIKNLLKVMKIRDLIQNYSQKGSIF